MKHAGCVDPKLEESLLEAAARDTVLSQDLAKHLDGCLACRTSIERARRIATTWYAPDPTRAELAAARLKFSMRGKTGGQPKVAPGVVAAAIVLTGAAAFASNRVMAFRAARLAVAVAATERDSPKVASKRPAVKPRGTAPSKDDAAPAPVSADTIVAVEDLPVARSATAAQVFLAQPRTASSEAPPAPPPPAPAGKPGSAWIDAAAALRVGDYARAEQMFGELAKAPDARTRDEARLARAQVWLAQGRRSEAQPELEELVASGATPLVRQRATQAIAALP